MRKDALKGSTPGGRAEDQADRHGAQQHLEPGAFACAKHFNGRARQAMKIVPLDPPVTRQSLRSGEVASGTTDSSPDIDLVNDKANFEVVCDGAVAGPR